MNKSETERTQLTAALAKHGLPAESYCTLDELRRKLSAAKAMDIKVEQPSNSWW